MKRSSAIIIHLAVAGAIVLLDLWTKSAVFDLLRASIQTFPDGPARLLRGRTIELIDGFFAFEAAINYGAFNGMLGGRRILLVAVSALAAVATLVVAARFHRQPRVIIIALGMIAGGALGNLYDRVRFGAVRDFIKVYIRGEQREWVWPNFNIADSAICCGVAIILLVELVRTHRARRAGAEGSLPPSGPAEASDPSP